MLSRSFSATNDNTCKTISEMNLPTKVSAFVRVSKSGNVQHEYIRTYNVCYSVPFLYDLTVIAPQPVDGLYDEQIAVREFFKQAFIFPSFKIFAALLFGENAAFFNAELTEGGNLPLQVLVFCRYPRVCVSHINTPLFFYKDSGYTKKRPLENIINKKM